MTTPKTKRDRAAGRHHRHTAIQTIIDNHDQVRADIDSLDNSIACLQDEVCESQRLIDHLNGRVAQHAKDVNANVGFAMQCIVENERKVAEIETAFAILKEVTERQMPINAKQVAINNLTHDVQKNHQDAIAQLDRYTKRLHGKQTNLNRELNLASAAVDEVRDELMWFGRLLIGLAASTTLGYAILFLLIIVK